MSAYGMIETRIPEAWFEWVEGELKKGAPPTLLETFGAGYRAAEARYAEVLASLLVDVENGAPKWSSIYAARTALTGATEARFDEYAYQAWRKALAGDD